MIAISKQHKEWMFLILVIIINILQVTNGDQNACDDIPSFVNAKARTTTSPPFAVGTVITFSCDRGYTASEGVLSTKCTASASGGDAMWDYSNSKCILLNCGFPGDVSNAKRTGDDFRFGQKVEYECYPGYEMKGLSRRYCGADGMWTLRAPVCNLISCGIPPKSGNGSMTYTSLTYQSIATYSCDNSFHFVGTDKNTIERRCQANKTWSGDLPVCKEILCPDPPTRPGITVIDLLPDKKRHTVGKQIYYNCESKDTQVASICTSHGIWSVMPQECEEEIFCPDPTAPPGIIIIHLSPDENKHKVGDIISYHCESTGLKTIAKCFNSGIWSPLPEKCEVVTTTKAPQSTTPTNEIRKPCGEPPPIEHGSMSFLESQSATYKCNDGFELTGPSVLTCLSSGKWDAKPPLCQKKSPIGLIVGIVIGVLAFIGAAVTAGVLFHKKRKSSSANKKASPSDAVTMDEVQRLEKNHKPIPVTVL